MRKSAPPLSNQMLIPLKNNRQLLNSIENKSLRRFQRHISYSSYLMQALKHDLKLIHISTFTRPILVAQVSLENFTRTTLGKSILCELNTTRNFITRNQCTRTRN